MGVIAVNIEDGDADFDDMNGDVKGVDDFCVLGEPCFDVTNDDGVEADVRLDERAADNDWLWGIFLFNLPGSLGINLLILFFFEIIFLLKGSDFVGDGNLCSFNWPGYYAVRRYAGTGIHEPAEDCSDAGDGDFSFLACEAGVVSPSVFKWENLDFWGFREGDL